MTRSPLARGCVVVRAGHWGVVFADRGQALDVLPIVVPHDQRLNDVLIELSELVACGGPAAHSVIRPVVLTVRAEGQVVAGKLPGPTWCRVAVALVRETQTAATEQRWSGDRSHRERARTRPVNLVSAK